MADGFELLRAFIALDVRGVRESIRKVSAFENRVRSRINRLKKDLRINLGDAINDSIPAELKAGGRALGQLKNAQSASRANNEALLQTLRQQKDNASLEAATTRERARVVEEEKRIAAKRADSQSAFGKPSKFARPANLNRRESPAARRQRQGALDDEARADELESRRLRKQVQEGQRRKIQAAREESAANKRIKEFERDLSEALRARAAGVKSLAAAQKQTADAARKAERERIAAINEQIAALRAETRAAGRESTAIRLRRQDLLRDSGRGGQVTAENEGRRVQAQALIRERNQQRREAARRAQQRAADVAARARQRTAATAARAAQLRLSSSVNGLAIASRNAINNLSFMATNSIVAGGAIRALGVGVTSQLPVLGGVRRALEAVIVASQLAASSFRSLRNTSGLGLIESSIRALRVGLASLGATITGIVTILTGLAAAVASVIIGLKSLGAFSRLQQTETVFGVLIGDAQETSALLNDLRTLAAETTLTFTDIRDAAQSLLVAIPANQVEDTLRRLGDLAAGTGSSIQNLSRNFAKAAQRGQVTQEVLELFQFQNVPIVKALAEVLKVSEIQVSEQVRAGKVNSKHLQEAIKILTDPGGQFEGAQEKLANTNIGLLTTIKDNIQQVLENIGRLVNELFHVGSVLELIRDATLSIRNFTAILSDNVSTFVTVFQPAIVILGFIQQGVRDINDNLVKSLGFDRDGTAGGVGEAAIRTFADLVDDLSSPLRVLAAGLRGDLGLLGIINNFKRQFDPEFAGTGTGGLGALLAETKKGNEKSKQTDLLSLRRSLEVTSIDQSQLNATLTSNRILEDIKRGIEVNNQLAAAGLGRRIDRGSPVFGGLLGP